MSFTVGIMSGSSLARRVKTKPSNCYGCADSNRNIDTDNQPIDADNYRYFTSQRRQMFTSTPSLFIPSHLLVSYEKNKKGIDLQEFVFCR